MFAAAAFLLLTAPGSPPATPAHPCDALGPELRARHRHLRAALRPYDCCDDTLGACLARRPPCPLVPRLERMVCRRLRRGDDDATIARAWRGRAQTALGAPTAQVVDLTLAAAAGAPGSPVALLAYADGRGPNCARLLPGLHRAVTVGTLRGKARLYLRLFPLRRHAGAKELGLVMLGAPSPRAFWDLALHAWARQDAYQPGDALAWAQVAGMDPAQARAALADPALAQRLSAGKREGLELGVTSTPTFFLDGRLYRGELEVDEIIDVVEEAFEARPAPPAPAAPGAAASAPAGREE